VSSSEKIIGTTQRKAAMIFLGALESGELNFKVPSLVPLLNSSYKFYVQSLDKLLDHIDATDLRNIHYRSEWATKIQMWTAEAIEDGNISRTRGDS
jgi:hypothetical protein